MSTDSIIPNFKAPDPRINQGPVYLITLSSGLFFLAIRNDESAHGTKAVGVFVGKTLCTSTAKVIENHKDIISKSKKEDFVEMSFPWHQVESIQNLAYRHKGP